MNKNLSLKNNLQNGEIINGCFIEMFSPIATEIVASSGYDFILIDLEHGPGSYTDAIAMMQAANQFNCPSIIRSCSSDTTDIKRTMDIGPQGLMVPMVNTKNEVLDVINACHYAPKGIRSSAKPIIRATNYGDSADSYEDYLVKDFLLMAQIESKEGLDNVEDIAAVHGIDMLFIGPLDLSASLGKMGDFQSTSFKQAWQRIVSAAKDNNKFLGTIITPAWSNEDLINQGFHLMTSGTDSMLLKTAAQQDALRNR